MGNCHLFTPSTEKQLEWEKCWKSLYQGNLVSSPQPFCSLLHSFQIQMTSYNHDLPSRKVLLLANRSEHKWCGLPGPHTFLSERLHSHVSLNYYCCGRTSRDKEKSVAGVRQMYTAISCLSWSIYNWSRQITHKGQREMWSRQSRT